MQDFTGKVALITGGTRGIGRAISTALAEAGCRVVAIYLSDHESAEKISSKGVHTIQAHIGDMQSRSDFWKSFDETYEKIDFFIANAATGVFKQLKDLSLNSLKKVMAVNVESVLEMKTEAIKRMPSDGGRIIALSSMGAERVIENYGSVGLSKAALEAMIRQLAVELGPKKITCNTVRAGLVDTGVLNYVRDKEKIINETISKTPMRKLVEPEDVAKLVCFLLSDEAFMINGQTITIDGGYGVIA